MDTPVPHLTIDLWSDVACPWCYLGKQRLDRAIEASGHAGSITVRMRAFELDLSAPRTASSNLDHLADKMGLTRQRAEQMEAKMVAMAHADGLDYVADRPHANSFDAHRITHLADSIGLAEKVFDTLQGDLFATGANVYEPAHLAKVAVEAGIPEDRVAQVLAGDEYTAAVRGDEREARRLGITGVPFAVFDGRLAVPGAVSVENYGAVIERVWEAR